MKQVSSVVRDFISHLVDKESSYIPKIMFNWAEIVGDDIAKFSTPSKIKKSQGQTILYVVITNSAIGTELHYMKSAIIDKITTFIGERVIDDLKFELRP